MKTKTKTRTDDHVRHDAVVVVGGRCVCRLGCARGPDAWGAGCRRVAGDPVRSTLIAAVGFWRVLAELIIETLWRPHEPTPPTSPWTDGTDMDRG